MKKLIITILFFAGINYILPAQTIYYGYDNSGNRKSRSITLPANKSADEINQENLKPVIDKIGDLEVKIYPNPTRGLLAIEFINYSNENPAEISLYSVEGKSLMSIQVSNTYNELNMTGLKPGNYYLIIKAGDKTTNWTVVKE